MKIINQTYIDRMEQVFHALSSANRIAVIHHTDPDGVCAGVLLAKTIERLRHTPIDLRINQKGNEIEIQDWAVERLRNEKIDTVFIMDLGCDQYPENLERIAAFAQIVIFDHHKIYNDVTSEKILLLKPHLIFDCADPSQYCTAKLCFDLCNRVVDLSDLDWIKTIGLIGDCGFHVFGKEIDETLAKYHIPKSRDYFSTALGRCAQLLSSAEAHGPDVIATCFSVVMHASSYQDILDSELVKYRDAIQSEIERCVQELARAEVSGDTMIYLIESKYNIKSKISTIVSLRNPHQTVIVAQEIDDEISISARRQDQRVKMNELLEHAVSGLSGGRAGGHIPAAGATIRKDDWNAFKENVFAITSQDTA